MNEELTHTFVFTPPDDSPSSWNLTEPSDFTEKLATAFPGATTRPEESWDDRSSRWTLSFEVPVEDAWLEGMVTTPAPGAGSLSVDYATPREAALLLQWFCGQYVPPASSVVFTTKLGLDNGVDDPRHAPLEDISTLSQALGAHAEAIENSLGE